MNRRADTAGRVLILAAGTVAGLSPALHNPWIWDDELLFGRRLPSMGFGSVWSEPVAPLNYRPLGTSLHYGERLSFGLSLWPYHLTSMLLAVAVTILVWRLATRLAGRSAGFAAALLFAVHPLHAEAGGMIYGQLELLAAAFTLLTIELWLQAQWGSWKWFAALAAALCAYCAKETALPLPLLLMALRVFHLGRRDLWRDLPFGLPAMAYLALRANAMGGLLGQAGDTITSGLTAAMHVKAVAIALGEYIRLSLLPSGQTLYYGHLRFALLGRPWEQAAWVAAGIALWWVAGAGRRALAALCAVWFLGCLSLVLQIVPASVLVAERCAFLATFGVCLLAGAHVAELPFRTRAAVLTVLAVAGVAATAATVSNWRTKETAMRSTVAAHPLSPMGHIWLADAIVEGWTGGGVPPEQAEEALGEYRRGLELRPGAGEGWVGIAKVEALRGNCEAAREALRRSTVLPDSRALAALPGGCGEIRN